MHHCFKGMLNSPGVSRYLDKLPNKAVHAQLESPAEKQMLQADPVLRSRPATWSVGAPEVTRIKRLRSDSHGFGGHGLQKGGEGFR